MSEANRRRFRVALSFPGERRDFVAKVAEALSEKLGRQSVFYDKYFEAELARTDLDLYLGEIYGEQSELIAPFFSSEYAQKKWCMLEWRNIRRIIFDIHKNEPARIMPFRFDDTKIVGLLPFDGYVSIGRRSPSEVAELILSQVGGTLVSTEPESEIPEYYGLPATTGLCFGREDILQKLTSAWNAAETRVCSLIAAGGVGKTSLVKKWIDDLKRGGLPGARIYSYSFYHQGALQGRDNSEGQTAADEFLSMALDWFGDTNPDEGSSINKADRLAVLIQEKPTLLILDGLEPLQHQVAEFRGKIRDKGIRHLIVLLARKNLGLCVITSRAKIADLVEFRSSHVEIPLENLSTDAGRELLSHLGVKGRTQELDSAVREFDGHALGLTLLGNFLHYKFDGNIKSRDQLGPLNREPEQGGHARRVMASYEALLKDSPELCLLYLLGLFDRPASIEAVMAIVSPDPIELRRVLKDTLHAGEPSPAIGRIETIGLASYHIFNATIGRIVRRRKDVLATRKLVTPLHGRLDPDLEQPLKVLRELGLVNPRDQLMPEVIDCHPVVRQHFGESLGTRDPAAWHAAHSCLFEHYQSRPAAWQPAGLEALSPLYSAVAHGCRANRHFEAGLVYFRRMLRGAVYSCNNLGAVASDLALMTFFFDRVWDQASNQLNPKHRALVFHWAGTLLATVGRSEDGVKALSIAKNLDVAAKAWFSAGLSSRYLGFLYCAAGKLDLAQREAMESVNYAQLAGNDYSLVGTHATLGHCLHQIGRFKEAHKHFAAAESAQQKVTPDFRSLHSVWGYWYCELLLDLGQISDARTRGEQALLWAPKQPKLAMGQLLDRAVAELTLARANLLTENSSTTEHLGKAREYSSRAIESIRSVDHQWLMPRALLVKAECLIAYGEPDEAKAELMEVAKLSFDGNLKLYGPDCELALAKLCLAKGDLVTTNAHLEKAHAQMNDMGCFRLVIPLLVLRAELSHKLGQSHAYDDFSNQARERFQQNRSFGWLLVGIATAKESHP